MRPVPRGTCAVRCESCCCIDSPGPSPSCRSGGCSRCIRAWEAPADYDDPLHRTHGQINGQAGQDQWTDRSRSMDRQARINGQTGQDQWSLKSRLTQSCFFTTVHGYIYHSRLCDLPRSIGWCVCIMVHPVTYQVVMVGVCVSWYTLSLTK